MRTRPQSPQDSVWPPSAAVRHAVTALMTSDLSAAEMPGMDLAIDITVAAEHLRHFQDWRHDGSGRRLILQPQPVERALRIADRGVGDLRIA